jgi:hypothetical protein
MYQKTIGVSAALLLPRLARNHAAGSVADGSAPRGVATRPVIAIATSGDSLELAAH